VLIPSYRKLLLSKFDFKSLQAIFAKPLSADTFSIAVAGNATNIGVSSLTFL